MPDFSLTQALISPAEPATTARRGGLTAGVSATPAADSFAQALDARMNPARPTQPALVPAKPVAPKTASAPEKASNPEAKAAAQNNAKADESSPPPTEAPAQAHAPASTEQAAKGEQEAPTGEDSTVGAAPPDPALLLGLLGHPPQLLLPAPEAATLAEAAEALTAKALASGSPMQPTALAAGSTDAPAGDAANQQVDGLLAELSAQLEPVAEPDSFALATNLLPQATAESAQSGSAQEQGTETDPAGLSGSHALAGAGHTPPNPRSGQIQQLAVTTPVSQPGWTEEVAQKLTFIARGDDQKAELVLTPPHLGKVEISLTLNGDQVSAQFVAPSPNVRDALEQALPRLREMLAGAGIQLGGANVSARDSGDQRQPGDGGRNGSPGGRGSIEALGTLTGLAPASGRGLVDTFA